LIPRPRDPHLHASVTFDIILLVVRAQAATADGARRRRRGVSASTLAAGADRMVPAGRAAGLVPVVDVRGLIVHRKRA